MQRNSVVLPVLLGSVLLISTGCFKQTATPQWVEPAEAKTVVATTSGHQHTVAGLSLESPFPFVRANKRLDVGLRDLAADIRANIVSYESWDATAADGTQKIVVNRITYRKGTQLNLDAATEGSVEDIMTGLENACKPKYVIHSQLVANLPGRYMSFSCTLPQEGPVYVESLTFADKETLWQVQVAFDNPAKRSEVQDLLDSVRMHQVSRQ